jgi:hypothetical protein
VTFEASIGGGFGLGQREMQGPAQQPIISQLREAASPSPFLQVLSLPHGGELQSLQQHLEPRTSNLELPSP